MPYQEAWWANDASLARLNLQRGTHGREGEHCGFLWEVGSRWGHGFALSWRALRVLGAASSWALLAPSLKRLAACYACGLRATIKAAVSWPLFLEMRDGGSAGEVRPGVAGPQGRCGGGRAGSINKHSKGKRRHRHDFRSCSLGCRAGVLPPRL